MFPDRLCRSLRIYESLLLPTVTKKSGAFVRCVVCRSVVTWFLDTMQVLEILADPSGRLPHEQRPVLPLVQDILCILLHRSPQERFSSSGLVQRLTLDMPTAANTMNPGPVVTESHVVLPGLGSTTVVDAEVPAATPPFEQQRNSESQDTAGVLQAA